VGLIMPTRGLRQGDLHLPYLLLSKGLNAALSGACHDNRLHRVKSFHNEPEG